MLYFVTNYLFNIDLMLFITLIINVCVSTPTEAAIVEEAVKRDSGAGRRAAPATKEKLTKDNWWAIKKKRKQEQAKNQPK